MTTLGWIILAIVWLTSVVAICLVDIVSYKFNNQPYTVGRAIVDLLVGSIGCGWLLMMWCAEKILLVIGLIFFYIAKLVSPILNKRIL